jgi:signal transduction histidine kinase/ActR/RegA family two-component response regulator
MKSAEPENVLILAPTGRDASLAAEVLEAANLRCTPCPTVEELLGGIGSGAGAAIVAEESLRPEAVTRLVATLAQQPPWSDCPIILLGDPEGASRRDHRLVEQANVTILERPFRMRTLLAAVRSGLRARRRQYDAQRAIQDRDQFLAMLGHELRNPLTAILFATQVLDASRPKLGTLGHQVDVVERQATRLSRLVDDLLDVSRVTTGKIHLRKQPVDLADVLRRSADGLLAGAQEVGVALSVEADTPLWVDADAVRLEQVFTNLLANGIKFTPAGGTVEAILGRLGPHALVTVRDSGVGIPADGLRRIFDLFAQLETTMDRSRGGLGIGLTLAKSLVELHGGSIQAASDGPGKGSRFLVTLPLSLQQGAHTCVEPRARPTRPKRIVLVEDNDDIREVFRQVLEDRGHEVHVARDGRAGLETILGKRPAVAFVDIGLPVMDGYELAREVRRRLGSGVTLVAVTGYGQPEDRHRAREAGFDEHLTKPVEATALQRVLEEAAPVPVAT